MKKVILVTTSIIVLSVGGLITANSFNDSKTKSVQVAHQTKETEAKSSARIVSNHGKVDGFNSLSELEAGSPIIVRGIKIRNMETHVMKSKIDDSVVTGYTESEFKIQEVFKNEDDNKNIQANQEITIGEKAFEFNNTIYTTNGYKGMKDDGEYLLFLVEEDGIFAPRAVTFGKIPLYTNDLEIYSETPQSSSAEDDHTDLLAFIFKDAREKYE